MANDSITPPGKLLAPYLQLSDNGLEELNQHTRIHHLKKRRTAVHKGDKVSGAYIVTDGCLRVFTYMPNGSESTLYLIHPGETCVFAINCLFNQLLYPAWVTADTETELAVINGPAYKKLFERETAIQNLTIHALSTAVFRLMGEIEQLQGWTLNQRLTNFLLNRATDNNVVTMTQQEIAGHLGSSREVIARALGELNKRQLIATGRGKIFLSDTSGLASLLT